MDLEKDHFENPTIDDYNKLVNVIFYLKAQYQYELNPQNRSSLFYQLESGSNEQNESDNFVELQNSKFPTENESDNFVELQNSKFPTKNEVVNFDKSQDSELLEKNKRVDYGIR